MRAKNMIKIEGYFEFAILLFLSLLFLFIIKSYITVLLFASVIVFLSYKPYLMLSKMTRNFSISAFLILLIIVVLLLYPTYWLTTSLLAESSLIIEGGKTLIETADFSECENKLCSFLEENLVFVNNLMDDFYVNLKDFFLGSLGKIFSSLSTFFVNLFVFLLAFFFLLRDGEKFIKYIKRIIPMKASYKEALFLRFRDVTIAVFFNTLFLAFIQGFLVGLGFWVIGFKSPIFWGIIASFGALLPIFGPSIVWLPGVIYLSLIGEFYFALGLLIYGLLLVSLIDNIIRPYFLTKSTQVHEFLILLSILGGIQVFGFFLGIFLGPIIISLLVSVINLYGLDFK